MTLKTKQKVGIDLDKYLYKSQENNDKSLIIFLKLRSTNVINQLQRKI